jgi:hypothetical protein
MLRYTAFLAVSAVLIAPRFAFTDEVVAPVAQVPTTYSEARSLAARTLGYKALQRIGLALHGYHDIFGQFPPAMTYASDGKTAHSWRVELLPVLRHYCDGIDRDKLSGKMGRQRYDALIAACGYDVGQPWDSPKNLKFLKSTPDAYRHPDDEAGSCAAAYYAVVGKGTAFDPAEIVRYTDIEDWPASTLMIIESRSGEPWTKPIDIEYSDSFTVPRFGGFTKNGFLAVSCDGGVHFVSTTVGPDALRAFISRATTDSFSIIGIPYKNSQFADQ